MFLRWVFKLTKLIQTSFFWTLFASKWAMFILRAFGSNWYFVFVYWFDLSTFLLLFRNDWLVELLLRESSKLVNFVPRDRLALRWACGWLLLLPYVRIRVKLSITSYQPTDDQSWQFVTHQRQQYIALRPLLIEHSQQFELKMSHVWLLIYF